MQDNIDNESTTGLEVPAFVNVLTIPPVAEKRQFGDESMNHCNRQQDFCNSQQDNHRNNQDHDNGGKRLKKETNRPGPNWAYSTQNLAVIRGYSLGSKENPLVTNFVCKEELATCLIRCASSATSRAGRLSKRKTKMPSLSTATRAATFGLMRRASKPKRSSFPRSTSPF